ncbi:MAG TPA: GNAT family N-acetyltransferase, partial [Polyangia bacterium]|nr:GNAT family N-acetyltransferase [Polyangia bacterium]
MADVTLRRATIADIEPLVLLFDGYRRFYENPTDIEGARRFLTARLEAGESVVFVADRDGRLVGFTQLYPS